MTEWKASVFKNKIYNDQYPLVDPEYLDIRPKQNFAKLSAFFGDFSDSFSHLDYGGGNGLMTKLLCDSGWRSTSYDPFNEKNIDVDQLGRYDLITAFEVFEHVADIKALMLDLQRLLSANGVILFSTALSDGNIPDDQRLTWWYASPRNGHISLFSKKSLLSLSKRNRFNLASNWIELHAFYTKPPFWANRVFGF
jgi:SAM-dependent methyltransferase